MDYSPVVQYLKEMYDHAQNPYDVYPIPKDASFPDERIGIEIEVEDCPKVYVPGWVWHEENSLRSEYNSEYVTAGSIFAGHAAYALDMLYEILPPTRNFAETCSSHVHVNMRGTSSEQWGTLFAAYYSVEPLLFGFVGNGRDGNNYCVPWSEVNLYEVFLGWEWTFQNIRSEKYAALNWMNLRSASKGTVEFRHWPGCSDRVRFLDWIKLITRLVSYAKRTRYADQLGKMRDLRTVSMVETYLEPMFGDLTGVLLRATPDYRHQLQYATRMYLANESAKTRVVPCTPSSPLSQRHRLTDSADRKPRKAGLRVRAGLDRMAGMPPPPENFFDDEEGRLDDPRVRDEVMAAIRQAEARRLEMMRDMMNNQAFNAQAPQWIVGADPEQR